MSCATQYATVDSFTNKKFKKLREIEIIKFENRLHRFDTDLGALGADSLLEAPGVSEKSKLFVGIVSKSS
jgi:hypothetical protein